LFSGLRYGLRARGYEALGAFVDKARSTSQALGLKDVQWVLGDFMAADLSDCTVAFLAWTTFPDYVRAAASRLVEGLAPGARVATLTHPLSSAGFELMDKERKRFSWGYATVHYYRKMS
jgi:hypothetical protein